MSAGEEEVGRQYLGERHSFSWLIPDWELRRARPGRLAGGPNVHDERTLDAEEARLVAFIRGNRS